MNKLFITRDGKLGFINQYLRKLLKIAEKYQRQNKNNCALMALSAYCKIHYIINQRYSDKAAEDLLLKISRELVSVPSIYNGKKDRVLFYDGFGLDLRGWAASFAKVLSGLGYNIVYVAPLHSKNNIPHIIREIENGKGIIEFIDIRNSYEEHVKTLNVVFNNYRPGVAFFYTNPEDVCGAAVFDAYKGKVKRIQVDLTDHAFWIGVNAVDYCLESRDIGISNAIYHRGFSKKKIVQFDCCPYINRDIDPLPLPFDINREKYIFSGGALYKTLGDPNLYFYKIIDYILQNHSDMKFLYAGGGDETEIAKILQKYPERMFHIQERSDFIRLIENSVFFLNTYPMFGGLMMRYSAMIGKVPLTLRHNLDHKGILKKQEELGIEFDTYDDIVVEADKLINDDIYRRGIEEGLKQAVVSEEEFARNLRTLIEKEPEEYAGQIEQIDTSAFQAEYINRLQPEEVVMEAIVNKRNLDLFKYFPVLFVKKVIRRKKYDKF